MNYLIAKTKGRNGSFFKVVSDMEIFELPSDLDNPKEYDSDYNLDEDEWFAVENFSDQDYCINFLTRSFMSTDYNQIAVGDYDNIEYLCSVQSGVYYFQKLSSSQLIRKKYLSLSNEPMLVENAPIIIIDNYPDAIYIKSEDTLYFKKLTSITAIFRGIDILYNEATQQETEEFLGNSFIFLTDGYSVNNVKKANRKRIAMAMATLNTFSPADKQSIFGYIKVYCEDLDYNEADKDFAISNEEDLKKLLYGIEQRYYTTILGGEKRLANSITTL